MPAAPTAADRASSAAAQACVRTTGSDFTSASPRGADTVQASPSAARRYRAATGRAPAPARAAGSGARLPGDRERPSRNRTGHPQRRIDAAQVERGRVAAQRLVAAPVEELVEVRHRELAQGAVHRLAVAQPRAVALRQRAPRASAAEQRDHVRVVVRRAIEVHDERWLAVDPQRAGGEERALDAVRDAVAEHVAHRVDGLAVRLVIGRERAHELLDAQRGVQARELRELARGQSEIVAAGLWRWGSSALLIAPSSRRR